MHGNEGVDDRRPLDREALRNIIAQWNANRLDIFALSDPNEDLEFHGVMRFYFQDSGQKVATKCIRVASDATVEDVIGTLIEKFRPDMRMLSVPSYALFELHEQCVERKMAPHEKPLLVQLNWHVDDREGRFLLRNIDDKTLNSVGLSDSNLSFRRKLSKREKKQLKKQEKLSRMKSEAGNDNDAAEKLYSELPETSFTRSISNPEAVMRRRRQQKLEKRLQLFRSKDGGPDTGGTLKIYGEALCKDVPYKTLLLSIRDTAGMVVREMLDKYGQDKVDPQQWCLVQVATGGGGATASTGTKAKATASGAAGANNIEMTYVLDDDECPLSILMNASITSSITFHVRRRPADCAPRKRKKKPGTIGSNLHAGTTDGALADPMLLELEPDGSFSAHNTDLLVIHLRLDSQELGCGTQISSSGIKITGPQVHFLHCIVERNRNCGVTLLKPYDDAPTYVNGQRITEPTYLQHGYLVKFGNGSTYRFVDPAASPHQSNAHLHLQQLKMASVGGGDIYDRSPHNSNDNKDNFETTFDLEGNIETISTGSGTREDSKSVGSASENRHVSTSNIPSQVDRFPRGQDPILPAVLEFPEDHQEQFLARVITHLDVNATATFRLAPAYTLYLCARYRASTHYRPELTPTERAHKLTLLLQHAAMLLRNAIHDRSTEAGVQAFWLANASEMLHFLKSDRHVSAFSLQAQDTLADAVQLAFKNLVAYFTDELNSVLISLLSDTGGIRGADGLSITSVPQPIIDVLSNAVQLLRRCRVNAALTIQFFSQLFHWISARALSIVINNPSLCNRAFGTRLGERLHALQAWAESQGLELTAECHLAKVVQCASLLQAPKSSAEDLAMLSSTYFKLNSVQLRALLTQYKVDPGEVIASASLLEQAARAAEDVADELVRADGRQIRLHDDPTLHVQLLLPDDGFSCDVVVGVPAGLAEFLLPLQASGLCRLAAQPTSSGQWTVYMTAPRPASSLSNAQPEVQVIRLHKTGGGMGLSIVAAKGAGQERLGIYIKSVVPDGAADKDGRLAAGDQLISVDGQSLLGITQEKAAEFLVRTGPIVTLSIAKGGAVFHGLATLLQQPSPTPQRGGRRMSERDLPSKIEDERMMPSSKSVPALHQITNNPEYGNAVHNHHHNASNPTFNHTYSNNSMYNLNNGGGGQVVASPSSGQMTLPNLQQYHLTNNQQQQQMPTHIQHAMHANSYRMPPIAPKSNRTFQKSEEALDVMPNSSLMYSPNVQGGPQSSMQYYNTTGSRRMSERDLPSKIDDERTILSSKSVPALHQIVTTGSSEYGSVVHGVASPGYSHTSSNNSIGTAHNHHGSIANANHVTPATLVQNMQHMHIANQQHQMHQQQQSAMQNHAMHQHQQQQQQAQQQHMQQQMQAHVQQQQQQQQLQQQQQAAMRAQMAQQQQQMHAPLQPQMQNHLQSATMQPQFQQNQQQPQLSHQQQNQSIYRMPPVAPKPARITLPKQDEAPELPPTSTHPLYSPSAQSSAAPMSLYNNSAYSKAPESPLAPQPPERGSSYTVMSFRNSARAEITKRVSFNDVNSPVISPSVPDTIDNKKDANSTYVVREDPDAFIRQAESMLAATSSPTEPHPPLSPSGNINVIVTATPGVIGAQEVYRDPRTRRLAEKAQLKQDATPSVPEKLTFKEKMKMFAMETGEIETPRDKSKISRAQRDIDNISGSNAAATTTNNMAVH